jgi:hypothetical protein
VSLGCITSYGTGEWMSLLLYVHVYRYLVLLLSKMMTTTTELALLQPAMAAIIITLCTTSIVCLTYLLLS